MILYCVPHSIGIIGLSLLPDVERGNQVSTSCGVWISLTKTGVGNITVLYRSCIS